MKQKHAPYTGRWITASPLTARSRPLLFLGLCLLSGIMLPLGLPSELAKFGNPFFGLCALVPLAMALSMPASLGLKFAGGAVFGALYHAISSFWLYFFKAYAVWTLGATTVAYGVIYGYTFVFLSYLVQKYPTTKSIVFACAWTLVEFSKSIGFLGYPWGLIAYSWSDVLPFVQIADSTSVYGPGWVLALANASIAEFILGFLDRRSAMVRVPMPRSVALAAAAFAVLFCYGAIRLAVPVPLKGSFTAIICQQNTDSWESDDPFGGIANGIRESERVMAETGVRPDLLCFSETTLTSPLDGIGEQRKLAKSGVRLYDLFPKDKPLFPFLAEHDLTLFTGTPLVLSWERQEWSNAVALVRPDGTPVATYSKMHPVPFAEAIPFWDYEWFRTFMRETVGLDLGWVMGSERTVFHLPVRGIDYSFAAPICFEDAFSGLCRDFILDGADFLLNLTNDSWSKTDSSETQHFVAAKFRSIEHRRTMVRSTNAGVSCVIGPYGETRVMLPFFVTTAALVTVPVYVDPVPTAYTLAGDWFPVSMTVIVTVLVALTLPVFGRKRPRRYTL